MYFLIIVAVSIAAIIALPAALAFALMRIDSCGRVSILGLRMRQGEH